MIDSRIFDGLIVALLLIGAVFGITFGAIVFFVIPWVWHHVSILIH